MQYGKGALYFIKPIHECSDNYPGPAKPFFKSQATPKTRQQMREDSPVGKIEMEYELDQHGKYLIATGVIFAIALAITYAVDWHFL